MPESGREIDLTELEKECRTLTHKAAKRMRAGRYSTLQTEGFIDKIVKWQQHRKVDKIKSLFQSLFPRLKSSEEEIRSWLKDVSEKREDVWYNGLAMSEELRLQVELYQNHLDFLDEAMNDVRTLDFDIVKEIAELKVAFEFNQEILESKLHLSRKSIAYTPERAIAGSKSSDRASVAATVISPDTEATVDIGLVSGSGIGSGSRPAKQHEARLLPLSVELLDTSLERSSTSEDVGKGAGAGAVALLVGEAGTKKDAAVPGISDTASTGSTGSCDSGEVHSAPRTPPGSPGEMTVFTGVSSELLLALDENVVEDDVALHLPHAPLSTLGIGRMIGENVEMHCAEGSAAAAAATDSGISDEGLSVSVSPEPGVVLKTSVDVTTLLGYYPRERSSSDPVALAPDSGFELPRSLALSDVVASASNSHDKAGMGSGGARPRSRSSSRRHSLNSSLPLISQDADALTWDGAAAKRESLRSLSVSLNSVILQQQKEQQQQQQEQEQKSKSSILRVASWGIGRKSKSESGHARCTTAPELSSSAAVARVSLGKSKSLTPAQEARLSWGSAGGSGTVKASVGKPSGKTVTTTIKSALGAMKSGATSLLVGDKGGSMGGDGSNTPVPQKGACKSGKYFFSEDAALSSSSGENCSKGPNVEGARTVAAAMVTSSDSSWSGDDMGGTSPRAETPEEHERSMARLLELFNRQSFPSGTSPATQGASAAHLSACRTNKLRVSYFLRKLPFSQSQLNNGISDPDQLELLIRMQKCIMLKETLKSVLKTVEHTHLVEGASLKQMKKLRNQLKTVCYNERQQRALSMEDLHTRSIFTTTTTMATTSTAAATTSDRSPYRASGAFSTVSDFPARPGNAPRTSPGGSVPKHIAALYEQAVRAQEEQETLSGKSASPTGQCQDLWMSEGSNVAESKVKANACAGASPEKQSSLNVIAGSALEEDGFFVGSSVPVTPEQSPSKPHNRVDQDGYTISDTDGKIGSRLSPVPASFPGGMAVSVLLPAPDDDVAQMSPSTRRVATVAAAVRECHLFDESPVISERKRMSLPDTSAGGSRSGADVTKDPHAGAASTGKRSSAGYSTPPIQTMRMRSQSLSPLSWALHGVHAAAAAAVALGADGLDDSLDEELRLCVSGSSYSDGGGGVALSSAGEAENKTSGTRSLDSAAAPPAGRTASADEAVFVSGAAAAAPPPPTSSATAKSRVKSSGSRDISPRTSMSPVKIEVNPVGYDQPEEAVMEVVHDLQFLLSEERDAKEKLLLVESLLESLSDVQLQLLDAPGK